MQRIPKAKQAKVIRLWLCRNKKTAIARKLGLDRSTVYRILWDRFGRPLPSVDDAINSMENSRKTNASKELSSKTK
jgi:hypothetical protein